MLPGLPLTDPTLGLMDKFDAWINPPQLSVVQLSVEVCPLFILLGVAVNVHRALELQSFNECGFDGHEAGMIDRPAGEASVKRTSDETKVSLSAVPATSRASNTIETIKINTS